MGGKSTSRKDIPSAFSASKLLSKQGPKPGQADKRTLLDARIREKHAASRTQGVALSTQKVPNSLIQDTKTTPAVEPRSERSILTEKQNLVEGAPASVMAPTKSKPDVVKEVRTVASNPMDTYEISDREDDDSDDSDDESRPAKRVSPFTLQFCPERRYSRLLFLDPSLGQRRPVEICTHQTIR